MRLIKALAILRGFFYIFTFNGTTHPRHIPYYKWFAGVVVAGKRKIGMTEITQLDQSGLNLIKSFEGCRLHAYLDSVGIPTIGWGMTYYPNTGQKVKMGDTITQEQADGYFLQLLKPYELAVYSTTRDDINQNQFNALVSLTYNIGTGAFKGSTVHRLVNANPNDPKITDGFMLWSKANGKPILLGRRKKEALVYFS